MLNKIKIKSIISICLSFVFIMVLYNLSVNSHYHINSHGMLIKHSHPYESKNHSPIHPSHNHSDEEMIWLALISNNLSDILIFTIFAVFSLIQIKLFIQIKTKSNYNLKQIRSILYRGPPALAN
jgi:hypothetical protein